MCHIVSSVRFPGAMVQAGVLDCLQGRIRNPAVCLARPVVFPVKTFPQQGQAPYAKGQQFTTGRADVDHPASWMLTPAKPQPWRPKQGIYRPPFDLQGPPLPSPFCDLVYLLYLDELVSCFSLKICRMQVTLRSRLGKMCFK